MQLSGDGGKGSLGLVEGVIRCSQGCENSDVNSSFFVHSFIIGAVTVSF